MATTKIDASMLAKMFLAGANALEAKKEWINELNVFPVPDGDTGTNMSLTIMSAAKEVSELPEDATLEMLSKAISSGSLRGARGNSGVILSQLIRGFTKVIKTENEIISQQQKEWDTTYKPFKIAKETGIKVAYDANYAARIWSPEEAKSAMEEVLPYIDIMFLNLEHDAKTLYGVTSPDIAIKMLWDKGVSIVVVRENNGNVSVGYNGEIVTKKQLDIEEIVDTTGSGDVFNGAFLYGIINGYTPFEALILALIDNYYQIQGIGAIKSIPDKDEVFNHYNSLEV